MKGLLTPWRIGPTYIGGIPIYTNDDRMVIVVKEGPGFDSRAAAEAIVRLVNADS